MIPSSGFHRKALCNVIDNLGKKTLLDLSVPSPKGFLPKLATKATG